MTGSIEKRGKDSYRLVVFKGYDLDGKSIRHQKTIHCKNKSEARTELAKYIAEVENGFIVERNVPTFKEFVEIWKRDYGQKELAPSTYYRYLGILESRILPYFGHFKLNKIRPIDIMQFYNLLLDIKKIAKEKYDEWHDVRIPEFIKEIENNQPLIRANEKIKECYDNGIEILPDILVKYSILYKEELNDIEECPEDIKEIIYKRLNEFAEFRYIHYNE